ncbi:MAG: hypothetical protein AB7T59_14155 [Hyphomonadaceae bacterium]
MKHWRIGAASIAAFAGAAHAEPGGTSDVYGPGVERGEAEFEYRGALFTGDVLDGAAAHRLEAGYAITDWWRPALAIQAVDPPGQSAELTAIAIENVFDFKATQSWPVHLGGYFEYTFGQNGADDAIEFKLLSERQDGALTSRINLIAERDVGDGVSHEWEYGYAARFMWRASDRWAFGVEGFGEPEAHAHYWGPRLSLGVGESSLALGYLAGFDEAEADGQFRVAFEIEN